MPGKSTAQTDVNYNGVEKAQKAANSTVGLSKKQRKEQNKIKNEQYAKNRETAKSAKATQKAAHEVGSMRLDTSPAQGSLDDNLNYVPPKAEQPKAQQPAAERKISVTEDPGNVEPAFSETTGKAQEVKQTAEQAKAEAKVKDPEDLLDHMKKDVHTTRDFFGDSANILSGKREEAEKALGLADGSKKTAGELKYAALKKRSGEYLSDLGGGSKFLGGAKIAGYLTGGAILLDMLNPFDDD